MKKKFLITYANYYQDISSDLLESAKKSHNNYNIFNINYLNEDVFSNWTPEKNYDVIVLTGSIETREEKLEIALKDSGRMFAVIGKQPVHKGYHGDFTFLIQLD